MTFHPEENLNSEKHFGIRPQYNQQEFNICLIFKVIFTGLLTRAFCLSKKKTHFNYFPFF